MHRFSSAVTSHEAHAEISVVIRHKELAERYIKNWQEHERHSEVYAGRGK